METGSSSSSSAAGGAEESLNGLKFGKKIYFEEAKAKKGKSGGGVVRCQVEGCEVDLSDAKAYYLRHKVCSMHSKSPKVIVAGIEQRFCQQCSRFHQLPEFDQGKRSCRRRLAGHNERRRKPSPGSMMSPYYGSLSPTLFENHSRTGGFVMDFSTYPSLTAKDSWHNTVPEQGLGNQPSPWQSDMQNSVPDFLRGSTNRPSFSGPGVSSEECFSGVSHSSTALSLLSNQPWGSRNSYNFLGTNGNGPPIVQPPINPGAATGQFSCPSWGFRGNQADNTSHEMPPNLGLGQYPHPGNSHYMGEPGVAQPSQGQYHDLNHSRGYDSSVQDMHWSL